MQTLNQRKAEPAANGRRPLRPDVDEIEEIGEEGGRRKREFDDDR